MALSFTHKRTHHTHTWGVYGAWVHVDSNGFGCVCGWFGWRRHRGSAMIHHHLAPSTPTLRWLANVYQSTTLTTHVCYDILHSTVPVYRSICQGLPLQETDGTAIIKKTLFGFCSGTKQTFPFCVECSSCVSQVLNHNNQIQKPEWYSLCGISNVFAIEFIHFIASYQRWWFDVNFQLSLVVYCVCMHSLAKFPSNTRTLDIWRRST